MNAGDTAFASFVAKLVQARPEFPIVRAFVAPDRRDALTAFECLAHELAQTAFHLPEAQVAAVKLQWWRDEIERAARGEGRHPISQALGETAQAFDARAVDALLAATLALREAGPPSDYAAQRAQAARVFAPIARLERAAFGATDDGEAASARARTVHHLLRETARTPFDDEDMRATLPLNRLARHQLSRDDLARPGAARDAAMHDQLADIAADLAAVGDAATLAARARARLDRRLVAAARRAADPLPVLWHGLARAPATTFWHAWREARRG
ncbi:squalene/phytoene synthase family protein [Tahibacter soli]|uniref:Squalene/phytoene synthase family protein n=1 Tax=Tahibacter soli TaxID=2983605 RepID=A0A9X3YQI3_9GAMM|nr:squalene/phytoene synthase family protein [Tahibacter soli]MDC8015153.1 squalene/phytoene synthase family protein [Tahibacter soli]